VARDWAGLHKASRCLHQRIQFLDLGAQEEEKHLASPNYVTASKVITFYLTETLD
jgi:hypothetical protein